ncbi:uncharacterized protein [Dermacentor albipictus]|uniref:uncharacterized protein isoform X1 n=1 Tax=Dermacentor albipictus TaxID=60249 RepID=UPI0038FC9381
MAGAQNACGAPRVRFGSRSVVLDTSTACCVGECWLPRPRYKERSNGGMVRSLVPCAYDSGHVRTPGVCGSHSGGKFLFVAPLPLAMDDILILDRLHQGLSATPTPSPLPDLVTSCRGTGHSSTQTEQAPCGASPCRDGAKVVGRRLRYLSDTLDTAPRKQHKTGEVVLHDWLTDFLATCMSSVVTWWKSSV